MSGFFFRRQKARPQGSIPSPLYLLEWAALLAVLFFLAHIAGLREFTSVLNGTIGSTNLSRQTAAFLGVTYVIVYLGFVIVVPVLLLAAAILRICQRLLVHKTIINEPGTKTQVEKTARG